MKTRELARMLCAALLALAALSGCVMNKLNPEPQTIDLRESVEGMPVTIEIVVGEEWTNRMQAGPFIFNVLPQFAIWAEDTNGNLVDTLYVSGADFNKLRHASKHGDGETFFRQGLPVWASRVEAAGGVLPSKDNPYPDSVTSATPMANARIDTRLSESAGPIVLFAEFNKSGDENAIYTKEANDWAGQPSLVYSISVTHPSAGGSGVMELLGHGGALSDPPDIYEDLSTFDTALNQVREIRVEFL